MKIHHHFMHGCQCITSGIACTIRRFSEEIALASYQFETIPSPRGLLASPPVRSCLFERKLVLHLLVYAIDAYLQSLDLPDLFPEHSSKYQHILSDQRLIFFTLATAYRDFDLVMTEPDIIAVDEAVRGFRKGPLETLHCMLDACYNTFITISYI